MYTETGRGLVEQAWSETLQERSLANVDAVLVQGQRLHGTLAALLFLAKVIICNLNRGIKARGLRYLHSVYLIHL
jgi:hypothetical protein